MERWPPHRYSSLTGSPRRTSPNAVTSNVHPGQGSAGKKRETDGLSARPTAGKQPATANTAPKHCVPVAAPHVGRHTKTGMIDRHMSRLATHSALSKPAPTVNNTKERRFCRIVAASHRAVTEDGKNTY